LTAIRRSMAKAALAPRRLPQAAATGQLALVVGDNSAPQKPPQDQVRIKSGGAREPRAGRSATFSRRIDRRHIPRNRRGRIRSS